MIANLKPYAEYKDSGLPWLDQVPAHWELRPAFGAFVCPRRSKSDPPCRSNIDPGMVTSRVTASCG